MESGIHRKRASGARQETVVRPARLNDDTRLSAFIIRAWKEAGPGALGFTGATDEAVGEIASVGFLSKLLKSPNVRVFVAEESSGLIGFASVRSASRVECELSGIVVLQSFAGRGVGTRLLRKASDAARKSGFRNMRVKTEQANERAIEFYKSNGFNETGRLTEKMGRVKVSLLALSKRLR